MGVEKHDGVHATLRKWFQGLHWIHWLVVFLSLVLTLCAWHLTSQQLSEKITAQFNRESDQLIELISERMAKYEDALWAGVATIHSQSHGIDYQEWKRFSKALQIDKKYPGINGIGVISHIQREELSAFLQKERRERPYYNVYPKHDGDDLWPIVYIEPYDINKEALGLDIVYEINRYDALKKARDTARAQITGPIVLVQDDQKTPGFLFYAPFYIPNENDTLDDRRANISGVVYAPFIVHKLMEGALRKESRHLELSIYDDGVELFSEHQPSREGRLPDSQFSRSVDLELYGRTWELTMTSTASFTAMYKSHLPSIILIGGVTIDVLLVLLFLSLVRAKERALDFAQSAATSLSSKGKELELIFNHVPARIWYKNNKNIIIRLNQSAAESMGGTISDFEGKDTYDLFPEMAKKYHEDDLGVIQSGKPLLGIIEEYTPIDGHRGWVRTDKIPYSEPHSDEKMILVVAQDITDIKQAEVDKAHLISTLEASNEELERFAYVASHDLQEPLRMIRIFTQLLKDKYMDQLNDEAQEYIDIANSSAERMQDLVTDLLDYSRIDSEESVLEDVDVMRCVEYAKEALGDIITKSQADIVVSPLPVMMANPIHLTRLFQNLIGNGIKYQEKGTPISIRISAEETPEEWIICVNDNGIGMKPEYCEQIFIPFKRLHSKSDYSGTGIGLAICRRIVDKMGGRIWVESELGAGSSFYFSVPKTS